VATTKGIVFVSGNGGYLAILQVDFQAAHGFTKVAVAVVGLRHDGGFQGKLRFFFYKTEAYPVCTLCAFSSKILKNRYLGNDSFTQKIFPIT
jgi:hypothetical protein